MGTSFSIMVDARNDCNNVVTSFEEVVMMIIAIVLILVFLFFSVKMFFFLHCPTCGKCLIPQWRKINVWERLDSIGGPTELEFAKGYMIIWQCRKCGEKYHFKKYKIVPIGIGKEDRDVPRRDSSIRTTKL